MGRRRRRVFGASARPTRERTGVPHINQAAVAEPVDRIVRAFDSCGTGDLVRPANWRVTTEVRDAASGAPIPVRIQVVPKIGQRSAVTGSAELYVDANGYRRDVVVLNPLADLCAPEQFWKDDLRNILTHELTHVVDPGLRKNKGPAPRPDRDGMCAYISHPQEVTAFLAQMREELRSFNTFQMIDKMHRKGLIKRPEDILPRSRLWATVSRCLKPAQKKRYLRMAAQLWQEWGFDRPSLYGARRRGLGGIQWMKYADPEAWKHARGSVTIEPVVDAFDSGDGELKLHAKIGGETVGELEAWTIRDGKSVNVSSIAVGPRGRGVGTKLYESAAAWACRVGRPLASDEKRSAFSDAFWKKQVRKKRARCAWRLTGEEARTAREDEKYSNDEHSIWARGGCVRYVLTRCPVKSLAGRPR